MLRAKKQFDDSKVRVHTLDSLFTHLTTVLHFHNDSVSDLLRSQVVYIVSAFDKLIHELVKTGMVETYLGTRTPTPSYSNFSLNLHVLANMTSGTQPAEIVFERHVIDSHRHLAFQDPDKVANALSLVWNETHKWQEVALVMGMSESNLRTKLKNIVIRRNQIVHESDLDLSTGDLQPIYQGDVQDIVAFISLLGDTIFAKVV